MALTSPTPPRAEPAVSAGGLTLTLHRSGNVSIRQDGGEKAFQITQADLQAFLAAAAGLAAEEFRRGRFNPDRTEWPR